MTNNELLKKLHEHNIFLDFLLTQVDGDTVKNIEQFKAGITNPDCYFKKENHEYKYCLLVKYQSVGFKLDSCNEADYKGYMRQPVSDYITFPPPEDPNTTVVKYFCVIDSDEVIRYIGEV